MTAAAGPTPHATGCRAPYHASGRGRGRGRGRLFQREMRLEPGGSEEGSPDASVVGPAKPAEPAENLLVPVNDLCDEEIFSESKPERFHLNGLPRCNCEYTHTP